MSTLDELFAKHKDYVDRVAACAHDFSGTSVHCVGPVCVKCGIAELPWLRAQREEARGCIRMLLKSAAPSANHHPMMWDAWGDASVWLGEDRNRYRIPHAEYQGNARALKR